MDTLQMACNLSCSWKLFTILTLALGLTACAANKQVCPSPTQDYLSNPVSVNASYKKQANRIYPSQVKFLLKTTSTKNCLMKGDISVSRYNKWGFKRQHAVVNDLMREKAASMGSNAIINLKKSDNTVTGTAVYYE